MTKSDVLRSIRYGLDINEVKVVDIANLAGSKVEIGAVADFLKREDEPGYVECTGQFLSDFLDGLIILNRGPKDTDANGTGDNVKAYHGRLTNNVILKKIRVAFNLKEEDLHQILDSAGFTVSKPELSAIFRKEGQKNYRECGDQLLRNFLKGLSLRLRTKK